MLKVFKTKGLFLIVVIVVGLLFVGCESTTGPEKPEGINEPVLNSSTIIVEEANLVEIQNFDPDTGGLMIEPESDLFQNIEIGSVIVSGPNEKFPQGILRKVISVDKSGEDSLVKTEQGTLEDLFEDSGFFLESSA